MAWTRKKIIKVLEKLERKKSTLEKEDFTNHIYARFHGGVFMWIIKESDSEFDRMFHTFQIEEAVDCILERIANSE